MILPFLRCRVGRSFRGLHPALFAGRDDLDNVAQIYSAYVGLGDCDETLTIKPSICFMAVYTLAE